MDQGGRSLQVAPSSLAGEPRHRSFVGSLAHGRPQISLELKRTDEGSGMGFAVLDEGIHVSFGRRPSVLHAVGPSICIKVACPVHAVDWSTVHDLSKVVGALDLQNFGPSVRAEAGGDFLKLAPEVVVGPRARGEVGPALAKSWP